MPLDLDSPLLRPCDRARFAACDAAHRIDDLLSSLLAHLEFGRLDEARAAMREASSLVPTLSLKLNEARIALDSAVEAHARREAAVKRTA